MISLDRRPAPRRPIRGYVGAAVYVALLLVAVGAVDWDLSWLSSETGRAAAAGRLVDFVGAFGAPDLSPSMLRDGFALTLSTLSIALWGTGLGVVVGYVVALGASRAVVTPPGASRQRGLASWARRGFVEACRLLLDVMRGVPDFAWAVLILTIPGPGAVTGILALGISVGGTLGKIYSESWDSIDPARYVAVQRSGGGRIATFAYGIQPLAARSMLSYTLMRAECTVRNASVIGVVGGGGLGGQLFDEFNYGHHDRVVTLLLFLLVLTASVDIGSNWLRHRLQQRGDDMTLPVAARRRVEVLVLVAGAFVGATAWLSDAFTTAWHELARIEWTFITEEFGRLVHPDLGWATLTEAALGAGLPLSLALISTTVATLAAALLAFPASLVLQLETSGFGGERIRAGRKAVRATLVVAARGLALIMRALPDVAWLLLAASCFHLGALAGVVAVALHSTGILARVFVEIVDDIAPRRLEPFFVGSRWLTYLYAAVPTALRDWRTYAVVQFEINVRAGLVLGIVGIGGLGDAFHTSFSHWSLPRAGTFLLAMVVLTACIDRLTRRLRSSHVASRG